MPVSFNRNGITIKNDSFTDIENFEMNFDVISRYQLCFYFRKLEISVIKIGMGA